MLHISGKCDEDCVNVQLGRIFNRVGDFATGKRYCLQVKDPFSCLNSEGMDCLITSHNSLHEEQQALPYLHQLLKCDKLLNIHHIRQLGNFFESQSDIVAIRQLNTFVSSHLDSRSALSSGEDSDTQNIPAKQIESMVEVEKLAESSSGIVAVPGDNVSSVTDVTSSQDINFVASGEAVSTIKSIHKEETKVPVAESAESTETAITTADDVQTHLDSNETKSHETERLAVESANEQSQTSHIAATGFEIGNEEKSSLPLDISDAFMSESENSQTLQRNETHNLLAGDELSIVYQHVELKNVTDTSTKNTNNADKFVTSQEVGRIDAETHNNRSLEEITQLSPDAVINGTESTELPELQNNSLSTVEVSVSLNSNSSTLLLSNNLPASNGSTTLSNATQVSDDAQVSTTNDISAPASPKPTPTTSTTKAKPCPILNSYQTLAVAYIQREDYVSALKQYTKIIKKCPWVVEMYFARAQIYHFYLEDLASSKQDYYHVYDQLHPQVPTAVASSCNISSGMITRNLWKLQEEFIDKVYPANPMQAIEIIRHIHPTIYEPFITAPLTGKPFQEAETRVETSEVSLMERLYRCQWIVSIYVELKDYVSAIQEIMLHFPLEIMTSFDPTTKIVNGFTASKHEALLLELISIAFHAAGIDSQYFTTVEEFVKIAQDYEYLTSTQQIGDLYYEHDFYQHAIKHYLVALDTTGNATQPVTSQHSPVASNNPPKKGLFHRSPGHGHHGSQANMLHYKLGRCYHKLLDSLSTNFTEKESTTTNTTTTLLQAYEHYEIALQSGLDYPEMRKFYATFAEQLSTLSHHTEAASLTTSTTGSADPTNTSTPAVVDIVTADNQTMVDAQVAVSTVANATTEYQENPFSYRAVHRRARTNRWIVSSKDKQHKKVDAKDRPVGSNGAGSSMKLNSIGGNGGGGAGLMQQLFRGSSSNEEDEDEQIHAISPFEQQLRAEEAKQEAEAKAEKAAKDAQAKINAGIIR